MIVSDMLTLLEAIAFGYALAGDEQAKKISMLLPPGQWLGGMRGIVNAPNRSAELLKPLGIDISPDTKPIKAIMDELVKREANRAQSNKALAMIRAGNAILHPHLYGEENVKKAHKLREEYEAQEKAK